MFIITDIEIRHRPKEKLLAYVTITIDHCLMIHNIKIIEVNGKQSIFMPDRVIEYKCPVCMKKIRLRANYCSYCGGPLKPIEIDKHEYLNIVHPLNNECREYIHNCIIDKYNQEIKNVS